MLPKITAWINRCKVALALFEYEITLELVTGLEQLGLCITDPTYQTASIALRDPSDGSHPDWERTVLHELVHVRMGGALGTEPGTEERSALERGVEMMTRSIYKLIKVGAPQRAISNVMRLCARTIATAREGHEGHEGHMNGARIAEIAMALGGMDLPEEAKTLVTELIGLASGDESETDAGIDTMPPEKDPTDPVVGTSEDEQKMYRKILGEDNFNAIRKNAVKLRRAQTIQLARTSLGAALTPHDEAVMGRMSPEAASAYADGMKRGAAKQGAPSSGYKAPAAPPVQDKKTVEASTLLRQGESLDGANGTKKITIESLETRANLRGLVIGKVV